MFSSLSQRIFGSTPRKNSSPGPTRPPRNEPTSNTSPHPSTAPPGVMEAASELDRQFTEVSETWGQADPDDNDDEDIPDGLPSEYEPNDDGDGDGPGDDDSDGYVDPFADMAAFSTQVKDDDNGDNDDITTHGSDGDASPITKAEASYVTDDKKSRRKKPKTKKFGSDGSPDQDLPSSNTSTRSSASAAEEVSNQVEVKADTGASPVSNKKKRKRKTNSSKYVSDEPQEVNRTKKRKLRKPLEDIEDDDMELQPEEMVPDSPSNQTAVESDSPNADSDHDLTLDLDEKPEPQLSQLVSVSRQLFQPTNGTSTAPQSVSDEAEQDGISDSDHEISMLSPSVTAHRRRSMSRGSQISSFRRNLSRESTGLPDRISEAAESREDESEVEEVQADPVVDVGGDVSMAESAALASGALLDDPDQEDFADQLPPSSQPPREDSPSVDGDAMKVDDVSDEDGEEVAQPQLPTENARATQADLTTTPGATSRRRKLDTHRGNLSELSHYPSSAQKSARSTGSRRQRSKPNFFDKADRDHFDQEENEEADDGEAEADEERAPTPRSEAKIVPQAPSSLPRSTQPRTMSKTPKSRAPPSTTSKSTAAKPKASKPQSTGIPMSPGPPRAAAASKGTTPLKRLARPPALTRLSALGKKEGPFDSEEWRMLDELVQSFRNSKGWTQEKMNSMIQLRKRQRQPDHGEDYDGETFTEMWDFICSGFLSRDRTKVMSVTRARYHNFKKRAGGWTQEEDERVLQLLEKHGNSSNKWVFIGEMMDRNPNDVRDRYRNYIICGQNAEGVNTYKKWTEEEEEKLVECVLTVLRRLQPANERLVPKKPMDYVNWQVVSDEMERTRSRLQCLKKWKQLNLELSLDDIYFPEDSPVSWFLRKARLQVRAMSANDKYKLVKSIVDHAPGQDEAIPWQKLVDMPYRKKWHRPTLKLLWSRLKQRAPEWQKKTVRDCARWLLEDAKHNYPDSELLDGGDRDGDTEAEEKAIRLSKKEPTRRSNREAAPEKKPARSAEFVEEGDTSEDDNVADQENDSQANDGNNDEAEDDNVADQENDSQANDGNNDEADDENSEQPSDEETGEPDDEYSDVAAVEDAEDTSNDQAEQQNNAGGTSKQSLMEMLEQAAPQLSFAPSFLPTASPRADTQQRSPMKKRILLSKAKTVNSRISEGDDVDEDGETPAGTPSQSQLDLDVRKIPDRKAEKRLAARHRVSSGSRARSEASVQHDLVENSNIDEDMPPIRIPPPTQSLKFKAINKMPSQGNFARRTGSSVLPGEPVELTDEVMAELEAASNANGDEITGSFAEAPVVSARKQKRRRRDAEVAGFPPA